MTQPGQTPAASTAIAAFEAEIRRSDAAAEAATREEYAARLASIGELDSAIELLMPLADAGRISAGTAANLADLCNRRSRWYDTVALLTPFAGDENPIPAVMRQFGYALMQLGRHAEAIAALRVAVNARPGDGKSRLRLAVAAAALGKPDQALRELALVKPPPASPGEALAGIGKSLVAAGCIEPARAVLARSSAGGETGKTVRQGEILMRRIATLDAGRARFAEAAYEQAAACQALGLIDEAAGYYETAKDHDPGIFDRMGLWPSRDARPDFLIIGAPRSGTTWLKYCLSHHPRAAMLNGEPEYFSRDVSLDMRDYFALFRAGSDRLMRRGRSADILRRGEKSAFYAAAPAANVRLCRAVLPDLRLVYSVRDPVARAWSQMKKLNVAAPCLRLLAGGYAEAAEALIEPILRHSRYELNLRVWLRHYPADRFLIVDFDDIASRPHAVMQRVCGHLGLEQEVDFGDAFSGFMIDANRTAATPMPEQVGDLLRSALGRHWDAQALSRLVPGAAADA